MPLISNVRHRQARMNTRTKRRISAALIAACIIGVVTALFQSGIVKINTHLTLGNKGSHYSFNPSRYKTAGELTLMEAVFTHEEPQENFINPGKPYKSVKAIYAFDCVNKREGTLQILGFYEGRKAEGSLVVQPEAPVAVKDIHFTTVEPGSRKESLLAYACNHTSSLAYTWMLLKVWLTDETHTLNIPKSDA